MINAQLSIVPIVKSTNLSNYVKVAIEVLKREHITFETNDMATVIETEDLDTLFRVVKKAHTAVIEAGAQRVVTELKIDDRKDKNATMASKLASLTK
jgi:uncharacterized protein (TIGR00106 family)